jgi:hypothetical protein
MRGPFVLSKSCVNMVVPPQVRGVFALSNSKDSLEILKHSDDSACEEIKGFFTQFKYFWFELAANPHEAFNIECEIYHGRLTPHNNGKVHPKAPEDSGWHCSICRQ